MIKAVLFAAVVSVGCVTVVNAQFQVEVYWTNRSDMKPAEVSYYTDKSRLQWEDFKGRPEPGGTAALTVSGFGYKANMGFTGTKGTISVAVFCYFDKTKSWGKVDKRSDYVLNHEQRHYDISYLAAARFVSELRKRKMDNENMNDVLAEVYDATTKWMNDMQDDYDGQTRNGLDKQQQESWNNRIDSLLAAIKG